MNSLLLLLCILAIFYYCYSLAAVKQFFSQPLDLDSDFHPPVTILKPICGLDWQIYDNLASFCKQDYPEYQIIFCLQDENDQGRDVINQIIADFPQINLSLVISDRRIGNNLKVSNLANAITEAKYPILLIADSDIRVGTNYLKTVIQPLRDPKVGVITCLYNSLAQGWLANFEALDIANTFVPKVVTAQKIREVNFAFGSTIVIRQEVLDKMGGFSAISDYLADDFQLGNLASKLGYQVVISHYLVEHLLADVSWTDFISRQIRWFRCIRVSDFPGYLGLLFTQGTAISLLFFWGKGVSPLSVTVLILTISIRLLMAWIIGVKILQDPVSSKFLWLVPLRDIVSFAIWCYGLLGNKIKWRGQQFKIVKDGKLFII